MFYFEAPKETKGMSAERDSQPEIVFGELPTDPDETMHPEDETLSRAPSVQPEHTLPTWGVETLDDGDRGGDQHEAESLEPQISTFLLRRCIGQGAFGEVLEAIQTSLGRVVAVKKLQDQHYLKVQTRGESSRFLLDYQFRQEAIITAYLEHPNIVPVYDLGMDRYGHPLLAMKLVRGEPWAAIIQEDFAAMAPADFLGKHLPILIDVCQAVAFAHSRGIVHRDLKPSQVMVGEFGEVLLMDWGLGVFVGLPEGVEGVEPPKLKIPTPETATAPAGTPSLMAPEQTLPHARQVTRLTDIYLLGGTLYYLLTGTFPHAAESSEQALEMARLGEVAPPHQRAPGRDIPGDLASLAMEALAPLPQDRFPSVDAFLAGLLDYLSGASARRQSLHLTEEVRRCMGRLRTPESRTRSILAPFPREPRQDVAAAYSALSECVSNVESAVGLWPANPDAAWLRTETLARYARLALGQGDLTLARVTAERVRDPRLRQDLLGEINSTEQAIRTAYRQRRIAISAVMVMLFVIAGGFALYVVDQQRINRELQQERDIAEEALRIATESERQALDLRRQAEDARQRAEREQYFASIGVADASLAQGRLPKVQSVLFEDTRAAYRQFEWGYLVAQLHPEQMILQEPGIYHAAFSPDGTRIHTAGSSRVSAWDATTGRRLYSRVLSNTLLWTVVPSPDGARLLAVSRDHNGFLLDAATGATLHVLRGHEDHLRGAAISDKLGLAFTGGADDVFRAWDMESGRLVYTSQPFPDDVYHLEMDESQTRLLVSSKQSQVSLHDAATGELLVRYPGHTEHVLSAEFSPDNRYVITTSTDRHCRVYMTESGELVRALNNVSSYLHDAFMTREGVIVTADDLGVMRFWDFDSGQIIREVQLDDPLWKLERSRDETRLVTTSRRTVRVFDFQHLLNGPRTDRDPTAEEIREHLGRQLQVYGAFEERDRAWDGRDRLWDPPAGASIVRSGRESFMVQSRFTEFSPDGRYRVDFDRDTMAPRVLDLRTGEVAAKLEEERLLTGAFSPDGRYLAVAEPRNSVHVYETDQWTKLATCRDSRSGGSAFELYEVIFTPDSSQLLVGQTSGRPSAWDPRTGERLLEFDYLDMAGICLDVDPAGKLLAAGSTADTSGIWNLETGELLVTLVGHQRPVYHIAFSPDGRRVVTSARDNRIKLWDVASGREVLTLYDSQQSLNPPLGARFTSDGLNVFAVNTEGQFLFFDAVPWRLEEYPGDAAGLDYNERLEWWKRTRRLGMELTAADIVPGN